MQNMADPWHVGRAAGRGHDSRRAVRGLLEPQQKRRVTQLCRRLRGCLLVKPALSMLSHDNSVLGFSGASAAERAVVGLPSSCRTISEYSSKSLPLGSSALTSLALV